MRPPCLQITVPAGALGAFMAVILAPSLALADVTAESAAVTVARANWYWQQASSQAGPLGPVIGPQEPSNVPTGDLSVAADPQGNATKETYLAFDLSQLSIETLRTVTIKMTEDASAQQLMVSTPSLVACRPRAAWPAGAGSDWSTKPTDDCSRAVDGTFDSTASTYSFEVSRLLDSLSDAADLGIAILPKPAIPGGTVTPSPFQLDFLGASKVAISVQYIPLQQVTNRETTVAPDSAPVPLVAPPVPIGAPQTVNDLGASVNQTAPQASEPAPPRRTTATVSVVHLVAPANIAALEAWTVLGAAVLGFVAWLVSDDTPAPADLIARRRLVRATARARGLET